MDDNNKFGTVYWFTGLAGTGKTTIGKTFQKKLLEEKSQQSILLDGDELRKVFDNKFGYSSEERKFLSNSYSKLCNLISKQGINVICCTISMFNTCRDWNRSNIPKYREIYITSSMDVLKRRNKKKLYDNSNSDVVGINLDYEIPLNPDVIIENEGDINIEEIVNQNFEKIIFL